MFVRQKLLWIFAASLYLVPSLSTLLKIALWVSIWVPFGGGHRWLYLLYHTWRRDLRALWLAVTIMPKLLMAKLRNDTVVSMFRANVDKFPEKTMLINCADGTKWTFQQVEDRSNQIANFFISSGYRKGDSVALFMVNCPEYVVVWLGLAKAGVVSALINYNLKSHGLVHTIRVANCRGVVYGHELESRIAEIRAELQSGSEPLALFRATSGCETAKEVEAIPGSLEFDSLVNEQSLSPVKGPQLGGSDVLSYMYTSGTTGLPKAAVIKHRRQILVAMSLSDIAGITSSDVVYTYLPLYHAIGLQLAMGTTIFAGATNVVRKKFSASNFWRDCGRHGVTAAPYIGEIARYLLAAPESSADTTHRVRAMFGNGLRPSIWSDFKNRFNIDRIVEIYGSTEGNALLINLDNKVGAIGFTGVVEPQWLVDFILPNAIVKVDSVTGELVRDKETGFCIKCSPGESGELLAKVIRGHMIQDFEGYNDQKESSKKIARDVFARGDSYFRSGDLIMQDEFGYMYFKDRKGDTFRWQGENVSTAEVENTLSCCTGITELTCYGVEVPGVEGRAGMVALAGNNVDLDILAQSVTSQLPPFARPRFIRVTDKLDMTSTFKIQKKALQDNGFDPRETADDIFYLDIKQSKYSVMTEKSYLDICQGFISI